MSSEGIEGHLPPSCGDTNGCVFDPYNDLLKGLWPLQYVEVAAGGLQFPGADVEVTIRGYDIDGNLIIEDSFPADAPESEPVPEPGVAQSHSFGPLGQCFGFLGIFPPIEIWPYHFSRPEIVRGPGQLLTKIRQRPGNVKPPTKHPKSRIKRDYQASRRGQGK